MFYGNIYENTEYEFYNQKDKLKEEIKSKLNKIKKLTDICYNIRFRYDFSATKNTTHINQNTYKKYCRNMESFEEKYEKLLDKVKFNCNNTTDLNKLSDNFKELNIETTKLAEELKKYIKKTHNTKS
jgi:hypothetical protein